MVAAYIFVALYSGTLEDGHKPLALRLATPETTVMLFHVWLPTGLRGVRHGGP
jgi:hypothetical protein